MSTPRKIIHIDMDAFYASVEQRDNPAYRGKPIAVGGRPEQRGAVAAASYEARAYGVRSAVPSRVAAQRCPHLIFVKPRFEVYRQVSQQIRDIFHRYTDWVEPLSLDEAYLDVTQNKHNQPSAMAIARAIKRDIYRETQLTASAGVSINKFLAKIASGFDKPNGLYLIAPDQAAAFVETLPISKFHGIGSVTAEKMNALGIFTGADLKGWSEADLVAQFGKVGAYYYQASRGRDDRPVVPNRVRKSIGAERSFAEDLRDVDALLDQLQTIATAVGDRLQRHRRAAYTLTLKVKYSNYDQITRSRTVNQPLTPEHDLYHIAAELLVEHIERDRPVRLLGMTLSNLVDSSAAQSGSDTSPDLAAPAKPRLPATQESYIQLQLDFGDTLNSR